MKLGGTEKATNGQMAKLGGTDTQTRKFRFCVSWQQNVGHQNSVAPMQFRLHRFGGNGYGSVLGSNLVGPTWQCW